MSNLQNQSFDYLAGLTKEEALAKISQLSKTQKENLSLQLAAEEVRRAKDNLLYYLDNFVYTQDEHDEENPIKKMPMHKQYMRDLAKLFLVEPLLLVEKSRQMMVTWLMCACHLWDAQFHKGRRIFFQSKKEADANHLVDRSKLIYENYPEPFKSVVHQLYPAKEPMSYLKLEFPKHNSIIQGTPQGDAVLRQYTASRIFSDEMGFQEKAEEAFIAAKPTIVGGGYFVGVSTPNFKNFYWQLAYDKL